MVDNIDRRKLRTLQHDPHTRRQPQRGVGGRYAGVEVLQGEINEAIKEFREKYF